MAKPTAKCPGLVFEPDDHVYRHGGRVIPSVTQVLALAGYMSWLRFIDAEVLRVAQERGHHVHRAVELLLKGQLDWKTVTPEVAGYLESFEEWARQVKFKPDRRTIERRFHEKEYGFAGTLDVIGTLHEEPDRAVVDWKSGGITVAAALQTGAYTRHDRSVKKRFALQLRGDGKLAKMTEFPERELQSDFAVFVGALGVVHHKRRHGLIHLEGEQAA